MVNYIPPSCSKVRQKRIEPSCFRILPADVSAGTGRPTRDTPRRRIKGRK
jgi:hypothetical protein